MKKINNYFNKGISFILDSDYRFRVLAFLGFFDHCSDEKYLKRMFRSVFNYDLDLNNPKTFSEKLQWLKLYDRNPLYTMLVDKCAVKKWVAEKLGQEYVVPNLGMWNSPDEIEFDKLPNQFVLKCNHNSGLGMCICKDKSKLDVQKVKQALGNGLKQNYYLTNREWPYKNVARKIIAEEFLSDGKNQDLADYKFFCFGGIPHYCQVITDRNSVEKVDFFDMNWQHQPFTGLTKPFPHADKMPKIPSCFEKMKQACHILAKDIPFVRVDFYEVNGKMYFGEMTFFPASGLGKFTPDKWNETIGDKLKLPSK
ncbi:MAG: hypothetical protein J6X06_04905 [Elusimicrobiaceae bacterium]|nr:hypothetical protein [Elusimicrobiaceae bacterium]